MLCLMLTTERPDQRSPRISFQEGLQRFTEEMKVELLNK